MAAHLQRTALLPRLALAWLILCALAMAAWPVYRAGLSAPIDPNEGWNACLADAAMGRGPLYPAPDQLITNNYPPLSFYAVGLLGKAVGDNVLAGRWLSLAAVLVIGWAVARMVQTLGGHRMGALVAGVWFAGTMCRYFTDYVGMDDPQLLAQALMAMAFARFLRAASRGEGCVPSTLAMVAAGFFKHNIIAMPVAALAWLFIYRRKEGWRCALWAAAAMAAGFTACAGLYGKAFIFNFLTPRSHDWAEVWRALGDVRYVAAGVAAWAALGWGKATAAPHLLAGTGLAAFLLQKSGKGVDVNAEFDWVIALSVVLGVVLSRLFRPRAAGGRGAALAQAAALLLLWAGWWMTPDLEICRLAADASFRAGLAGDERAMAAAVAEARAAKADVDADPLVCYRAGKPLVVDKFNVEERMRAGTLPQDAVSRLIEARKLVPVGLP